jgi:hypothetical protein
MVNQNLGQPVKNKHRVAAKKWRKWSNHAKKVFNDMYESLRPSMQQFYLHPDAPPQAKKFWAITRWNVAWEAADVANRQGPLRKVITV